MYQPILTPAARAFLASVPYVAVLGDDPDCVYGMTNARTHDSGYVVFPGTNSETVVRSDMLREWSPQFLDRYDIMPTSEYLTRSGTAH